MSFDRSGLAPILKRVARVRPGQAAQRHQPRHETEIGVRFAGPDKLVDLIEAGEVVSGLGRQRILRNDFSSYSVFIPNQVLIRTGKSILTR